MADAVVDFDAYVDVRFHFAQATYAWACACIASESQEISHLVMFCKKSSILKIITLYVTLNIEYSPPPGLTLDINHTTN